MKLRLGLVLLTALGLALGGFSRALEGGITTVAGGAPADGSRAAGANLPFVAALSSSPSGDIYAALWGGTFARTNDDAVVRIDRSGHVTTVLGGALCDGSGIASTTCLARPRALAVDASGNLFVADTDDHRIMEVPPGGSPSVLGQSVGLPSGLTFDPDGRLYVSDWATNRVWRLEGDRAIAYAGVGACGTSRDGIAALKARLCPGAIAFDPAGNLFVAEVTRHGSSGRIREIDSSGHARTLSATGGCSPALWAEPSGACVTSITVTSAGLWAVDFDQQAKTSQVRLFASGAWRIVARPAGAWAIAPGARGGIVDASFAGRIERLSPSGAASLVTWVTSEGVTAVGARIIPQATVTDPSGDVYMTDMLSNRVKRVDSDTGLISTVWTAPHGAILSGLALDSYGRLIVADRGTPAIHLLDLDAGTVTDIETTSDVVPWGIAAARDGSIYAAEQERHRVVKIDPWGSVSVVAGGRPGFSGDGGSAINARLLAPTSVALASDGTLYIADEGNNRVRRVGTDGVITTVAGRSPREWSGGNYSILSGNSCATIDDGLRATRARLCAPAGVAVSGGTLYISEWEGDRIRAVDLSTGIIRTVAGLSQNEARTGDAAVLARLYGPWNVSVGADHALYVSEIGHAWEVGSYPGRVRRIQLG